MISLPHLTKLDPTKLDLTKLDPTKLDLTKLDPTKLDLTRLDPRRLDLSRFDLPARPDLRLPQLPHVPLPAVELDRVADVARDAAYVGIGAAVVVTRAADARRRALADRVGTRVRRLVDAVA